MYGAVLLHRLFDIYTRFLWQKRLFVVYVFVLKNGAITSKNQ
jgi:hypothetical protein